MTPPVQHAASITIRMLAVALIGATGCGDPLPTPTVALTPAELERVGLTLPGGNGGVPFDCAVSVLVDEARNVRVIDGTYLLPKLLERKGELPEVIEMYASPFPAAPTTAKDNAPLPGQVLAGKLDELIQDSGPLSTVLTTLQDREKAAANALGMPDSATLGDFCLVADRNAPYDTLFSVLYRAGIASYTKFRIVEAHVGGRWIGTSVEAPRYGSADTPDDAPAQPFLTVVVQPSAIVILSSTADVPSAELPASTDPATGAPTLPMSELTVRLRALRGTFDAAQPIVVVLHEQAPASVLTQTFTAVRADAQGELFPRISLGLTVK